MTKNSLTTPLTQENKGLKEPLIEPKKRKRGKPTSYDPKYCDEIIKYFSVPHSEQKLIARVTGKNDYEKEEYKEVANPLPFLSGFARFIDVETKTLNNWCGMFPEFLRAYTRAKDLQHEMLHCNSLKGLYDARYAVFAAKNITDWRDKVEVDHGVSDELLEKYKEMTADELIAKSQGLARLVLGTSGDRNSNLPAQTIKSS